MFESYRDLFLTLLSFDPDVFNIISPLQLVLGLESP